MEMLVKSKENKTRYVLLGLLSQGREATGYELKKLIDQQMPHFWSESFGQIYPTLKEMELAGLVETQGQMVGQKKRYPYRITAKGQEVFDAWLKLPPSPELVRHELLLKFFFATPEERATLLAHLVEQKSHNQETLKLLEQQRAELLGTTTAFFRLLTLEYGLRVLRAEEEWLNYAQQQLTQGCL